MTAALAEAPHADTPWSETNRGYERHFNGHQLEVWYAGEWHYSMDGVQAPSGCRSLDKAQRTASKSATRGTLPAADNRGSRRSLPRPEDFEEAAELGEKAVEQAPELRIEEEYGKRQHLANLGSFLVFDDSRGPLGLPIASFREERDATLFQALPGLVSAAKEVTVNNKLGDLFKWVEWYDKLSTEDRQPIETMALPKLKAVAAAHKIVARIAEDIAQGKFSRAKRDRFAKDLAKVATLLK